MMVLEHRNVRLKIFSIHLNHRPYWDTLVEYVGQQLSKTLTVRFFTLTFLNSRFSDWIANQSRMAHSERYHSSTKHLKCYRAAFLSKPQWGCEPVHQYYMHYQKLYSSLVFPSVVFYYCLCSMILMICSLHHVFCLNSFNPPHRLSAKKTPSCHHTVYLCCVSCLTWHLYRSRVAMPPLHYSTLLTSLVLQLHLSFPVLHVGNTCSIPEDAALCISFLRGKVIWVLVVKTVVGVLAEV